ncbi:MAG: hypothetical protein RSG96_03790 [Clostridia bacterium]
MENEARGRDMLAPVEHITIDGKTYKMVYNNQAARIAEDIYEQYYGKDVGFADILQGIIKGKYSAIMALFYAGMAAGGCEMAWPEFDEKFKLDSVEGIREMILRGIGKALPDVGEGGTENP